MKEKWKARQEQLHMCECSLGAREPGGAGRGEGPGRGDVATRWISSPAGEEPPQHHSSAKFRAKGLGEEDPADTLLEACP